jgi:hypothetical protein
MEARRYCWLSGAVALLSLLAGCRGDLAEADDASPQSPETPLVLRLNDTGQFQWRGRWVDLYTEANRLNKHLRAQSQRYRELCQDYQIPLPKQCIGLATVELLPVEVQIEIVPGTKPSYVMFVQRACREHGFTNFSVRYPDDYVPAAN